MGNVKFTLMLKNLTIDESGHYACQAENILGNESRLTSLNVTYRFIIPVTTGMANAGLSTSSPGHSLLLKCRVGTRLPKYSKNRGSVLSHTMESWSVLSSDTRWNGVFGGSFQRLTAFLFSVAICNRCFNIKKAFHYFYATKCSRFFMFVLWQPYPGFLTPRPTI